MHRFLNFNDPKLTIIYVEEFSSLWNESYIYEDPVLYSQEESVLEQFSLTYLDFIVQIIKIYLTCWYNYS